MEKNWYWYFAVSKFLKRPKLNPAMLPVSKMSTDLWLSSKCPSTECTPEALFTSFGALSALRPWRLKFGIQGLLIESTGTEFRCLIWPYCSTSLHFKVGLELLLPITWDSLGLLKPLSTIHFCDPVQLASHTNVHVPRGPWSSYRPQHITTLTLAQDNIDTGEGFIPPQYQGMTGAHSTFKPASI